MPLVTPSNLGLWERAKDVSFPASQVRPYLVNARLIQSMERAVMITAPMLNIPFRWALIDRLVVINPIISNVSGARIGLHETSPIMPLTPFMVYRNEHCDCSWEDENEQPHFRHLRGFAVRVFSQAVDALDGRQIFARPGVIEGFEDRIRERSLSPRKTYIRPFESD